MKRIIDGMSAKQIAGGCGAIVNRVELEEYLESLCKPEPSWEDDVSKDNPILCWVSDIPLPKSGGKTYSGVPDYVTGLSERGYMSVNGCYWKHARPISPNDIWQPTQKGDTK